MPSVIHGLVIFLLGCAKKSARVCVPLPSSSARRVLPPQRLFIYARDVQTPCPASVLSFPSTTHLGKRYRIDESWTVLLEV